MGTKVDWKAMQKNYVAKSKIVFQFFNYLSNKKFYIYQN